MLLYQPSFFVPHYLYATPREDPFVLIGRGVAQVGGRHGPNIFETRLSARRWTLGACLRPGRKVRLARPASRGNTFHAGAADVPWTSYKPGVRTRMGSYIMLSANGIVSPAVARLGQCRTATLTRRAGPQVSTVHRHTAPHGPPKLELARNMADGTLEYRDALGEHSYGESMAGAKLLLKTLPSRKEVI